MVAGLHAVWSKPMLRTFLILLSVILGVGGPSEGLAQSSLSPGYAASDADYSSEARAGREIWFFATAFNDRFYTYSYPQRLGGCDRLVSRFSRPRISAICFKAGAQFPIRIAACPAIRIARQRAWTRPTALQWCPGDEELLKFVGRTGYRDPACDFKDAPFDGSTPHGSVDQRQSSCDLLFGTSTGALGLRKFPNPRFDAEKWHKPQWLAFARGRATASSCRAIRPTPTRAQRGCSTARSNRRSASAWPAAPATSPTIR